LPRTDFHGRQAHCIENEFLRVTILEQGGHIAEIFDKRANVSPLWIPHWDSIEPADFGAPHYDIFGDGPDAKLLAGIMGHNVCLDIFGGPSNAEALAGYTVHGEASVLTYQITELPGELSITVVLPLAQLSFRRSLLLRGNLVQMKEWITNLTAFDRPIAWTQHVTLGPPFLDPLTTQFTASVDRSIVAETDPGRHAYLTHGEPFRWPFAPGKEGRPADLRRMHATAPASGYTAHLVDKTAEHAFFTAFSPEHRLAFSYIWKAADYPWLGIWEENCSRQASPWNGRTITRGMEFGVSPFPESRREMVGRPKLFGSEVYRWLSAEETLKSEYWIHSEVADSIPGPLDWPGITT
jgi:hypothetical protein